jgi:hypothetical protein
MTINLVLLTQLPLSALYKLLVWAGLGVIFYFVYGIRRSKIGRDGDYVVPGTSRRINLTDEDAPASFYGIVGSADGSDFFGP